MYPLKIKHTAPNPTKIIAIISRMSTAQLGVTSPGLLLALKVPSFDALKKRTFPSWYLTPNFQSNRYHPITTTSDVTVTPVAVIPLERYVIPVTVKPTTG